MLLAKRLSGRCFAGNQGTMAVPIVMLTNRLGILAALATALALPGRNGGGEQDRPERSLAGGNYNIPLWEPGKVPLAKGDGPLDNRSHRFPPPEGKRNGASVVIAPGGGNIMMMYGARVWTLRAL